MGKSATWVFLPNLTAEPKKQQEEKTQNAPAKQVCPAAKKLKLSKFGTIKSGTQQCGAGRLFWGISQMRKIPRVYDETKEDGADIAIDLQMAFEENQWRNSVIVLSLQLQWLHKDHWLP